MKITTFFVAFISAITMLAGCSNIDTSSDAGVSDIEDSMKYSSVSHMAFMGGSVLYNPKNAAMSQLAKNVCVATRLGKVTREDIDDTQTIFKDDEEAQRFGFIKINSIDSSKITFSYTEYSQDGKNASEQLFSLKRDESIDINGDGLADLKYTKPSIRREGLENSLWLTFLSSQDDLNTSMFSVIPDQYSRSVYPNGLLGINPDGRFLVNKYDVGTTNRAAIAGISYGDYVLDSETGEYQKFIGTSSYRSARAVNDGELETTSTDIDVDFRFTAKDFYLYDTPINFIKKLPAEITDSFDIEVADTEKALEILNAILLNKNLIQIIATNTDVELDVSEIKEITNLTTSLSEYELLGLNRLFLEAVYENCFAPVDTSGGTITEILPLVYVYLGGEKTKDNTSARAASFSEYENERNSIEAEFDTFHKLSDIPGVNRIPNIDKTNFEKDFGIVNAKLQLGLMGKYKISWSHVEGTLGAVAFFKAESTLKFSKTADKNFYKKVIPFSQDFLNFRKSLPIGPIPFSLGLSGNIEIPCELSGAVDLSTNLFLGVSGLYGAKATVGADFGTKWVKWKKIFRKWIRRPSVYIDPFASANLINRTAYYIGTPVKGNPLPANFIFSGKFILSPTLNLTPKIGVCENTIWLGCETSNILDLGLRGTMSNLATRNTLEAFVDYRLKLKPKAGIDITLPVIHKGFNKTYENLPSLSPVKKNLKTWQLF